MPWALAEADRPVADRRGRARARCFRARSSRCSTRARWAAPTTSRPCCAWRGPAGRRSGDAISICFSVRGNRADELRAAVGARRYQRLARAVRRRGDVARARSRRRICISSACAPIGPASWSLRSSSRRWRSAGRSCTPAPPTRRSRAGSPSTTWAFACATDDVDAIAERLHAAHRRRRRARALARKGARCLPPAMVEGVTNDRWDRLLRDLLQARA